MERLLEPPGRLASLVKGSRHGGQMLGFSIIATPPLQTLGVSIASSLILPPNLVDLSSVHSLNWGFPSGKFFFVIKLLPFTPSIRSKHKGQPRWCHCLCGRRRDNCAWRGREWRRLRKLKILLTVKCYSNSEGEFSRYRNDVNGKWRNLSINEGR